MTKPDKKPARPDKGPRWNPEYTRHLGQPAVLEEVGPPGLLRTGLLCILLARCSTHGASRAATRVACFASNSAYRLAFSARSAAAVPCLARSSAEVEGFTAPAFTWTSSD